MAAIWNLEGLYRVNNQQVNWTSATIKVMACNAFTINQSTQTVIGDVSSNQITATGYIAGGATLTSKVFNKNVASLRTEFQAANTTWTITGTMSAQIFVFYVDTGTPSTSYILGYDDKGTAQSRTNDDFVLEYPSTNVLTISLA